MSLIKRIEVLEKQYKPVDLKKKAMEDALTVLSEVLHAALPADELEWIKTPTGRILRNDSKSLWFGDKLNLLAKNIENELINEDDQRVLDSLPQGALDEVKMTAIDYVFMLNELLNTY